MMFYTFNDLAAEKKVLKNPSAQFRGKWADVSEVDRVNGESEKCPQCGRHISMLQWLQPWKIKLSSTKYPDRLYWYIVEHFIVSERFKEAYESSDLKGIVDFTPVEVVKVAHVKKTSLKPPLYYNACVVRSNARIDHRKSIIKGDERDICELCNPKGTTINIVEGITLDTEKWEGEDIFRMYELSSRYFVTQRFVDFCKENNFTNFPFVPTAEYKCGID